ncbi:hypothetical protein MMC30_000687 [Trapelia coarctata]|nr:hypothetical protein [Trapelia coarctata]
MARLNEPPAAPVESIEALKRRFVRQNREIARANSTQSIRIRNLEAETSRLLSENLFLRQRIINLQNELDDRPGKALLEEVGSIKDKMEIKLAELDGLVFDLGRAQKSGIAASSPSRRHSRRRSTKRSPDQRNWRNPLTLSEATGGQDGRLPPIVEDKYFPRRTLDPEDILGILSDPANSDSPDLRPPPIAHFDDGDPIKYDANQPTKQDETTENLTSGFANLETRKKRRESSFGKEPGHSLSSTSLSTNKEEGSIQTGALSAQPLKLGAKRKLSVRDDESHIEASIQGEKDGFRFNRITDGANMNPKEAAPRDTSVEINPIARKIAQDLATTRGALRTKSSDTSASTTARKALGEKSVNTDPVVSPAKTRGPLLDKHIDLKKDAPPKKPQDRERDRDPSRPRGRPATSTAKPIRPSSHPAEPTTFSLPPTDADPPPATPTPDLFPPLSAEPSTSTSTTYPASTTRPGRDTPPPSDLDPSASSTATTGRASRRQRGSVSYAEPNLRDKMRRPGKELVDAVPGGAEERGRGGSVRAGSCEVSGDSHTVEKEQAKVRTVLIKKEEGEEEREWERGETRAEPASPLEGKMSASAGLMGGLPASVLTDRRRRASGLLRDEGEHVESTKGSGAANAVAALVAGTARKDSQRQHQSHSQMMRDARTRDREDRGRDGVGDAGDGYDFHGSESETEMRGKTAVTPATATEASQAGRLPHVEKIRVSRRVSSVVDGLGKVALDAGDGRSVRAGGSSGAGETLNPTTGSLRRGKRRDTLANAESDADGREKDTEKEDGARGVGTAMGRREERALGRRRSMMV